MNYHHLTIGERSCIRKYHIQVKAPVRDDLAKYLRDREIYTTFRYFPLHRVKHYGICGQFPNADFAADHTLCLPLHQCLTDEDVKQISALIYEFGEQNHLG